MFVDLEKAPPLRHARVAVIGRLAAPPRADGERRQTSSPSPRHAGQLRLLRAAA